MQPFDRRRSIRLATEGRLTGRFRERGLAAPILDVSVGGLLVEVPDAEPIGATRHVTIEVPGAGWSEEFAVRVVSCRPGRPGGPTPGYLVGLAFLGVDAASGDVRTQALVDRLTDALRAG
jgi:hypothetical protein